MDVRVGLWRKLSAEELMLLNCGVGEDSWESLDCEEKFFQPILKEISPGCSLEGLMLKLKLQSFITKCKELTHWKRPSCWEKLRAGGEGDDRGWDGWKASPTLWTWVWVYSRSWWWTGKPGMLRSMGSQRVRHNWGTELTGKTCMVVVFPTFFNLSLNMAIRSLWPKPQSAPSLVVADCIELLHLWLQRI